MKNKFAKTVLLLSTLFVVGLGCNLEAKTKTRVGFSFGSSTHVARPVYVAPRVQPAYVYPTYVYPAYAQPYVYEAPVYQPVYVYPEAQRSTGFSFSWSNFWR